VSEAQNNPDFPHEVNSQEGDLSDVVNCLIDYLASSTAQKQKSKLDGLPGYIEDIKSEILTQGREKIKLPNTVFVTEIVGYYYPYEGQINDYQRIKGALYHQAIQSLLRIECTSEVSIERQFEGVTIKGRVDLMCGDWLGEIKGSKYSRNQGMLQLQIYNWILGGGKKMLLIYSDLSYEIVPPNPHVEEMIRKYLKAKLF